MAAVNDLDQYWQIEFNELYRIQQVLIQGREDAEMRVTSFKILFPSDNGTEEYADVNGKTVNIFTYNQNSKVALSRIPLLVEII